MDSTPLPLCTWTGACALCLFRRQRQSTLVDSRATRKGFGAPSGGAAEQQWAWRCAARTLSLPRGLRPLVPGQRKVPGVWDPLRCRFALESPKLRSPTGPGSACAIHGVRVVRVKWDTSVYGVTLCLPLACNRISPENCRAGSGSGRFTVHIVLALPATGTLKIALRGLDAAHPRLTFIRTVHTATSGKGHGRRRRCRKHVPECGPTEDLVRVSRHWLHSSSARV